MSLNLNPDICAISSSTGINNIAASSYTLQASNPSLNLKKKLEGITFPSFLYCSLINQAPYISSVSEKEMRTNWSTIPIKHGANVIYKELNCCKLGNSYQFIESLRQLQVCSNLFKSNKSFFQNYIKSYHKPASVFMW